jgi:hypothetical protein
MARSIYIYVVCHNNPLNPDPPHVKAAFTVKHEMIHWLKNCDHYLKSEFVVYRMSDGDRGRETTKIPPEELK